MKTQKCNTAVLQQVAFYIIGKWIVTHCLSVSHQQDNKSVEFILGVRYIPHEDDWLKSKWVYHYVLISFATSLPLFGSPRTENSTSGWLSLPINTTALYYKCLHRVLYDKTFRTQCIKSKYYAWRNLILLTSLAGTLPWSESRSLRFHLDYVETQVSVRTGLGFYWYNRIYDNHHKVITQWHHKQQSVEAVHIQ